MSKKSCYLAVCLSLSVIRLWAAESPAADPVTSGSAAVSTPNSSTGINSDDLKRLRERIAKQEEEIKQLQQSVEEQRELLDRAVQTMSAPASVTTIQASNQIGGIPMVPAINVQRRPGVALQKEVTPHRSPLSIQIGNTTFSPLGFVDATFYGRSTNVGSGIGTNFAGIPYNTSATEHLSEANFSTQNSRIGFRVDSEFEGAKVLGYFEADFLGNSAGNVYVTSNSDTFRMRNVFVDVQKYGFEILGGQDWSLATPNRKGLSPLPADIFYTQVFDTNYQVGLPWSRQSQFRFIAHPTENFAYGLSLENPQQYVGGSGGLNAAAVTLPAATSLSALAGTQLNNGGNTYSGANLHPDIILKSAYDGHVGHDQIMHVEAAAIIRSFKDTFPFGTPASYRSNTVTAVSGEVNANLEVAKGFRLIANTFFGSGNGRYLFGTAPDLIVRANGSLSPVHSYSTVDGIEAQVSKNNLFYAYYGGAYIKRDVAIDTTGRYIGYGYPGSSNNDNRAIQEGTIGLIRTFWKNPNYGALSLITQYSYLTRNPWAILTGTPSATHSNLYFVDLRYTLP